MESFDFKDIKKIDKKYWIIGGITIVLLIGTVVLFTISNQRAKAEAETLDADQVETDFETVDIVPTVDPSVKVTLEDLTGLTQDVELSIKGIPKGTEELEYEMTFDTEKKGIQGVFGTIELEKNEKEIKREIFLGTESSGSKTPFGITGPILLRVKFSGENGDALFEEEIEL